MLFDKMVSPFDLKCSYDERDKIEEKQSDSSYRHVAYVLYGPQIHENHSRPL